MLEGQNNIDAQLRDKLDGFEMTPPDGAWAHIEQNIQKKKRRGLWLWITPLFIVLSAIAGSAVYYHYSKVPMKPTLTAATATELPQEPDEQVVTTAPAQHDTKKPVRKRSVSTQSDTEETPVIIEEIEMESPQETEGYATSIGGQLPSLELRSSRSFLQRKRSKKLKRFKLPSGKTANSLKKKVKKEKYLTYKGHDVAASEPTHSSNPVNIVETSETAETSPEQNMEETAESRNGFSSSFAYNQHSLSVEGYSVKGIELQEEYKEYREKRPDKIRSPLSLTRAPRPDVSKKKEEKEETLVLKTKSVETTYTENSISSVPLKSKEEENAGTPSVSPFLQRLSIDLGAGVSTYRLKYNGNGASNASGINGSSHTDYLGYNFNATFNYDISKSFAAYAGVNYSYLKNRSEYQTNYTCDCFVFDSSYAFFDTVTQDSVYDYFLTPEYIDVTTNHSSVNRVRLFTIPFGFSYKMDIGVLSDLELRLGGSIGIYQRSTGVLGQEDGKEILANQAFRLQGSFSGTAAVRYLYNFGHHSSIYAEPWVRVGINNFSRTDFNYRTRLINGGFNVGYRFRF